jgi:hypothetical protein
MYKVLIGPALTYASETWTLSKMNERQLSLFERKVLRCVFGAKQENGTWRKRYSCELYGTFKEPNVVTYIKVKRLGWAGHLVRMNNDRRILIVVIPCILIITQLLFQQNALVY